MGIMALEKIQIGAESTAGTGVAATVMWPGKGTLQPNPTILVLDDSEDSGYLMGIGRTCIPYEDTLIKFAETAASYEHLPYILEAGIQSVSPSQDGTGPYVYTYSLPTAAARTHRTYTIEGGDNIQEREAAYCFVKKFTLSGEVKKPVMVTAEWVGRQSSKSTFTSLTPSTTRESILFQMGKLYIDSASTFPATTQKTLTLKKFNLEVETGFSEQPYGDGRMDFSNTKQIRPKYLLKLTYEHNATAVAELDALIAETFRSIRLIFTGSAIAGGSTYTAKTFVIDLLGKYTQFDPFEDMDGDTVLTGTLQGFFNQTATSAGRLIVANGLSALA